MGGFLIKRKYCIFVRKQFNQGNCSENECIALNDRMCPRKLLHRDAIGRWGSEAREHF